MIIENTNTHVTLCPKYTHGTHRRQHISLSAALIKEFGVVHHTRTKSRKNKRRYRMCRHIWDRKRKSNLFSVMRKGEDRN